MIVKKKALWFIFHVKKEYNKKKSRMLNIAMSKNLIVLGSTQNIFTKHQIKSSLQSVIFNARLEIMAETTSVFVLKNLLYNMLLYWKRLFQYRIKSSAELLQRKVHVQTVLRSPFVYKNSMEQLGTWQYKIKIKALIFNMYLHKYMEVLFSKHVLARIQSVNKKIKVTVKKNNEV